MHSFRQTLLDKLQEALRSVLPVMGIVLLLCFTIAPISSSILLCFLLGAALLVIGMMLFTLGVEASMTPMGERVGTAVTRRRSLPLLIAVGLLLGFLITISEPDLQVLANQVPAIPNAALILSVAFGVGIFLVIALLRMLLGVPLPHLLTVFYLVVFGLAALDARWIIVPVGMVIGFFLVKAEPAVYVLNKQVEEVTDGAISAQAMGTSLSIGVVLSVGLAMVRVLTGVSILWFLIPGYAIALGLSFFVPKIFTAIAFDSGGVASGPMTAAFLLPFAQGACVAVGGSIVTDAFGVVAMVAMTPLITIQVLGLVSELQKRRGRSGEAIPEDRFRQLDDDAIIEL